MNDYPSEIKGVNEMSELKSAREFARLLGQVSRTNKTPLTDMAKLIELDRRQVRQAVLREVAEYKLLINASDNESFKRGVEVGVMLYQNKLKSEAAKLDDGK